VFVKDIESILPLSKRKRKSSHGRGIYRDTIVRDILIKKEDTMKYKPTYSDKQRDEQKRRKQEELLRNRQEQPDSTGKPAAEQEESGEKRPQPREKRTA
jgi:hypothetical protein